MAVHIHVRTYKNKRRWKSNGKNKIVRVGKFAEMYSDIEMGKVNER